MITRAKIVQEVAGSNGYKWLINIPILYGRPDSEDEKKYFPLYSKSTSNVQTNSDDVKLSLLQKFLNRNKKTVLLKTSTETPQLTEDIAKFTTVASVCGIPNSKIMYQPDDTVIVGFENNDMGKPIILGALLTSEIESKSVTKIDLNARTLNIEDLASMPLDATVFKRDEAIHARYPDRSRLLTLSLIEDAVLFVERFNSLGLTLEELSALFTRFDTLQTLLNNKTQEETTE